MNKGKWLALAGIVVILAGCLFAAGVQTAGGVKIRDVRFVGADGAPMSALLYVPPNATPKTPAPGILAVHGYFNSREVQDAFAIEFARRGYVVLALDQTGHGYSASPTVSHGFGGPNGLKYLRTLDFVDKDNIGLEGHSMGGWTVLTAAAAVPNGYRAMVLEGSGPGRPFAPTGTPTFPRNLAVVFSQYDEFAGTMWGATTARRVGEATKLQKVFATTEPVVPDRIYGDIAQGTARILRTPPITHAQDHFSPTAVGYAIDWFQHTLKGGSALPSSNQIWPLKEAGTLIALVGFVLLMLGAFDLLLDLPWFAPLLAASAAPKRERRDRGWWCAWIVCLVVPAATYLPLMLFGAKIAPPSHLFPQAFTNQILLWALVNGAVALGVSLATGARLQTSGTGLGRMLVLAAATVGVGYISLAIVDAIFKLDYRIWFVGFKLLNRERFFDALAYVLPFTAFAILALGGLPERLALVGQPASALYLTTILTSVAGFVVFLLAEYLPLFLHDRLLSPGQGLYTIMAVQFIPLLGLAALITTYAWRRTGRTLPGAVICGLLFTWYVVAGQAIQAG